MRTPKICRVYERERIRTSVPLPAFAYNLKLCLSFFFLLSSFFSLIARARVQRLAAHHYGYIGLGISGFLAARQGLIPALVLFVIVLALLPHPAQGLAARHRPLALLLRRPQRLLHLFAQLPRLVCLLSRAQVLDILLQLHRVDVVAFGRQRVELLRVDRELAVGRRLLALAHQDLAPDLILRDGVEL